MSDYRLLRYDWPFGYDLFNLCAGQIIDLAVTNDVDHAVHNDFLCLSGKSDMFHVNAKRFNRRLDKTQAPHEYAETIGGHTWRNWRWYLADFMVKINQ